MKRIAIKDDMHVDNNELHSYEDSNKIALKAINIKCKNEKQTFWKKYKKDFKAAFAKKEKPDMTKIQTDEEYRKELNDVNWRDS